VSDALLYKIRMETDGRYVQMKRVAVTKMERRTVIRRRPPMRG